METAKAECDELPKPAVVVNDEEESGDDQS
jgi:hypothetical protein